MPDNKRKVAYFYDGEIANPRAPHAPPLAAPCACLPRHRIADTLSTP